MIDIPSGSAGFAARGAWLAQKLMEKFSLSDIQACGIVGNLGFESAGLQGIHERGVPEGQGGYGWAQWTGPRRRAFFDYCNKHDLAWNSDEASFGYLIEELSDSQRRTITQVKKTTTLEAAVFTVGYLFERPAGTTNDNLPGFNERLDYAKQALAALSPQSEPVDDLDHLLDIFESLTTLIQRNLEKRGLYAGKVDGIWGPETQAALDKYNA